MGFGDSRATPPAPATLGGGGGRPRREVVISGSKLRALQRFRVEGFRVLGFRVSGFRV